MFSNQRVRGEWFKLSGPVSDYINSNTPIDPWKRDDPKPIITERVISDAELARRQRVEKLMYSKLSR